MGAKKGSWLDKYLLSFAISLLRVLPYRTALAWGSLMGRVLWLFNWRKVNRAEARCVCALGVGVTLARGIVASSYVNLGRSVVEFARMDKLGDKLSSLVAIEGKEILDEALARGKGVLMMTAHIGNWELAGARLVHEGYSLAPIYTPQRDRGGMEGLIYRQRTEVAGLRIIPSEGMGLRKAFRTLRSEGILVFLQDLDARKDGICIPFLGMLASTATGMVSMYRKFGSPVVAAVVVRDPDGVHHTIHVQEILSDLRDEDGNPFGTDVEKSLRICNNILGKWVATYPDQWMWLLDKWEFASRLESRGREAI